MLATLAALQLLAAAQGSAALAAPGEMGAQGAGLAQESGGIPPPAEPPGEERRDPPTDRSVDEPGSARAAPAQVGAPAKGRQLSLLSAEPLLGGSVALAWAGWSSFGAAYAIGFTQRDDAGVFLDYDWAKSETRIGVTYRRPLAPADPLAVAFRVAVAWYENFGATYVHDSNHSDRGFEVVPGLSVSASGRAGVFSALVDAGMTVTTKYESGFLFSPRMSFAFEAPIYDGVSIGARAGFGYRAGSGGAPVREGRGELQFLVLAGYQVL